MAAAQVSALSVAEIAARLDNRFNLLANGWRTAPARHQTLRAALDWSYALLTENEKALLARLSVFAGGWTLEAAEEVCADLVEARGSGFSPPTSGLLLLTSHTRLSCSNSFTNHSSSRQSQ